MAQDSGALDRLTDEDARLVGRIVDAMHPDSAGTDQQYLSHHDRVMLARAALRVVRDEAPILVAEVRRLRAERDRLRSVAHTHVFDPENYISPLRPQIRALRDAILSDDAGVSS